jgi:hypothetical protein
MSEVLMSLVRIVPSQGPKKKKGQKSDSLLSMEDAQRREKLHALGGTFLFTYS